jgi:hypothetical protein
MFVLNVSSATKQSERVLSLETEDTDWRYGANLRLSCCCSLNARRLCLQCVQSAQRLIFWGFFWGSEVTTRDRTHSRLTSWQASTPTFHIIAHQCSQPSSHSTSCNPKHAVENASRNKSVKSEWNGLMEIYHRKYIDWGYLRTKR